MTVLIPKNFVDGNRTGNHRNISDSYEHLEAVVSDEVYVEDLNMEDILHCMDPFFVYDTVLGINSSVYCLESIEEIIANTLWILVERCQIQPRAF
jgi:hypothetical protein